MCAAVYIDFLIQSMFIMFILRFIISGRAGKIILRIILFGSIEII